MPYAASFIDQLADWLATQNIGANGENLTVGTNMFVDGYPATPDTIVSLLRSSQRRGAAGDYIPTMDYPGVQVMIRSADYAAAESIARRIYEKMNARVGLSLPNFRVLRIHAYNGSQYLGEDETGRKEFSINFDCQAVSNTSI